MQIQIQKLHADAICPTKATPDSAGYDLHAALEEPITIPVGEIRRIPTGIAMAPDRSDVALLVFPRSGLAAKHGITLANSVGVVDADYRGEIQVPLINHGTEPFVVSHGMRIAQLLVVPVLYPTWTEVSALDATQRGDSGFGSSGI